LISERVNIQRIRFGVTSRSMTRLLVEFSGNLVWKLAHLIIRIISNNLFYRGGKKLRVIREIHKRGRERERERERAIM